MDSRRLPGKVVTKIAGKPLLVYLFESLRRSASIETFIVATTDRDVDDPVANLAQEHGVPCFRGSTDDVAGRMLAAARSRDLDVLVRVNADSPLLDYRLIDQGVSLLDPSCDLVSNTRPRTAPHGQSVEVIRVEALERARRQTADPDDLEHVTPYLYAHPEEFAMRVLPSPTAPGAFRFTIDTPEDLQRIELLVDRMTQPHWTYDVQALRGLANDE